MTKQDIVQGMQHVVGSSDANFITMTQICRFIGVKKPEHAKKYVKGLDRLNGKYYFIREVASLMMEDTSAE